MALEDVLEEQGVPENIWSTVSHWGLVAVNEDEPEFAVYTRNRQGKCATCGAPLREDTVLFMMKHGIGALFCGGQCFSDMMVTGWLTEQYEDMVQQIKFRGNPGVADGPQD